MKKLILITAFVAALTSCADSYVIEGSSSVPQLDGSKLYLKVIKDKELTSMDSWYTENSGSVGRLTPRRWPHSIWTTRASCPWW